MLVHVHEFVRLHLPIVELFRIRHGERVWNVGFVVVDRRVDVLAIHELNFFVQDVVEIVPSIGPGGIFGVSIPAFTRCCWSFCFCGTGCVHS